MKTPTMKIFVSDVDEEQAGNKVMRIGFAAVMVLLVGLTSFSRTMTAATVNESAPTGTTLPTEMQKANLNQVLQELAGSSSPTMLQLVSSDTSRPDQAHHLYVGLQSGESSSGSPIELVSHWRVELFALGQGAWAANVLAPVSALSNSGASMQDPAIQYDVGADGTVTRLGSNPATVNKVQGTQLTPNIPLGELGSPKPSTPAFFYCIVVTTSPFTTAPFGVQVISGGVVIDCNDDGVYFEDVSLVEWARGFLGGHGVYGWLHSSPWGWIMTNSTSLICKGTALNGWFTAQSDYVVSIYGLAVSGSTASGARALRCIY